eukprot:1306784-Amphidinium_carterae.1
MNHKRHSYQKQEQNKESAGSVYNVQSKAFPELLVLGLPLSDKSASSHTHFCALAHAFSQFSSPFFFRSKPHQFICQISCYDS